MARKKRRSKWEQRFFDWLDRQPEGGIFHRMVYSSAVSNALKDEQPFWFWIIIVGMLICLMLPMMTYSVLLELLGHGTTASWDILLYLIGFFASLFAGIGTANLYMIPAQKLCEWRLRKDFSRGFAQPFYLGRRVSLIFLGGCGTLAALCVLGIHGL